MKEYFDCLIMTHGAAFGAGAGIFLLTVLLVAKRVIGFFLSVIMLLLALGISWSINNEPLVRTYLHQWIPSVPLPRPNSAPNTSVKYQPSETNTLPSETTETKEVGIENLKGQTEAQKSRVKTFLKEGKTAPK